MDTETLEKTMGPVNWDAISAWLKEWDMYFLERWEGRHQGLKGAVCEKGDEDRLNLYYAVSTGHWEKTFENMTASDVLAEVDALKGLRYREEGEWRTVGDEDLSMITECVNAWLTGFRLPPSWFGSCIDDVIDDMLRKLDVKFGSGEMKRLAEIARLAQIGAEAEYGAGFEDRLTVNTNRSRERMWEALELAELGAKDDGEDFDREKAQKELFRIVNLADYGAYVKARAKQQRRRVASGRPTRAETARRRRGLAWN